MFNSDKQQTQGKRICGAEAKRNRKACEDEVNHFVTRTNYIHVIKPKFTTGSSSSKRGPEHFKSEGKNRWRSGNSSNEITPLIKMACHSSSTWPSAKSTQIGGHKPPQSSIGRSTTTKALPKGNFLSKERWWKRWTRLFWPPPHATLTRHLFVSCRTLVISSE